MSKLTTNGVLCNSFSLFLNFGAFRAIARIPRNPCNSSLNFKKPEKNSHDYKFKFKFKVTKCTCTTEKSRIQKNTAICIPIKISIFSTLKYFEDFLIKSIKICIIYDCKNMGIFNPGALLGFGFLGFVFLRFWGIV
jgi:hypothetical protein